MEAMPGNRLWGGPATNYIPDKFKEKVYRQFVDFMLQLHSHPFHEIGMLFPDSEGQEKIGEIVDQHARLPNVERIAEAVYSLGAAHIHSTIQSNTYTRPALVAILA